MSEEAAAAPATKPAADPKPTTAAPPQYDRASEIDAERHVLRSSLDKTTAELTKIQAERDKASAENAALRAQMARLQTRADLSLDDDDDADRVISAYEREHADVKPEKRPKLRDWVKSEEGLAKLPKSIRATYGATWTGTETPAAQPNRGQAPSTNRGTAPAVAAPPDLRDPKQRAAATERLFASNRRR
jgi:hypothetical protein